MFTSDTLLARLKAKIKLPDGGFEDANLLYFADTALTAKLVPQLIQAREEFYVRGSTESVSQGGTLRLPSRAYGGVIREIKLIVNGKYKNLIRTAEEDWEDPVTQGEPDSFMIRGNRIVFSPTPNQAYSVFLTYWLQPPRLVTLAECAQITAVNGATITCTPPSSWTAASRYDIVKGTSDYEPVVIDQTVSAVGGSSITFNSAPSDAEVGDYVCLAGESPYAYLQSSYYPVLLQFTVSLIHEANGDLEQKAASDAEAEAMLGRLQGVYSERIQGAPKKIVSSLL